MNTIEYRHQLYHQHRCLYQIPAAGSTFTLNRRPTTDYPFVVEVRSASGEKVGVLSKERVGTDTNYGFARLLDDGNVANFRIDGAIAGDPSEATLMKKGPYRGMVYSFKLKVSLSFDANTSESGLVWKAIA